MLLTTLLFTTSLGLSNIHKPKLGKLINYSSLKTVSSNIITDVEIIVSGVSSCIPPPSIPPEALKAERDDFRSESENCTTEIIEDIETTPEVSTSEDEVTSKSVEESTEIEK